MNASRMVWAASAVILLVAGGASALDMQTVPVGSPGNAGELSGAGAGGYGPDVIAGAVDYTYNMGKFEVTAGQYAEFLNAVARTDPYALYNPSMSSSSYGCQIVRSGSSGTYTYTVAAEWANRPVNFVSFGDACRFANWLHNGQPVGAQTAQTTEDGAYTLSGATSEADLLGITRNAGAKWAVPSEDEWYKAAYYNSATNSYYDYPTSSNIAPANAILVTDPGNSANYYSDSYGQGSPYWRSEVGEFENSSSPSGTFDQGGNVWEWTEALIGSYRNLRGGSFGYSGYGSLEATLQAADRRYFYRATPMDGDYGVGFRVVQVPEPGTIAILAFGSLTLLRKRRQRQQ